MLGLFEKFRQAVSHRIDPLAETQPAIEWVKWVHNDSLAAFVGRSAPTAYKSIAKVASLSGQLLIKTKDGDLYKFYCDSANPQWHGLINGEAKQFRSAYLDNVVDNALQRGLRQQPSAHEIFTSIMSPHSTRMFILWNGTDEQVARIDEDYPSAPAGFKDHHSPADLAEKHPQFAAYLIRKGLGPFWYDRGYDAAPEAKPAQATANLPGARGPDPYY
ncbi:MAG: hypothetical protein KKA05_07540 [Alphaproteobacteria bacterium]|nr:hypothetical protein [Alphaproteobacteria bacterium]MBU0859977.1 hypothetical protein [Alphaproteobacteria bacterium]